MYQSLGQQQDVKRAAGACARGEAVDAHSGDWRAFLRRHERDVMEAARKGIQGVGELAPHLLKRVADSRNLRAAADYLRQKGERAPGPNGIRLTDLESPELWEMSRVLGGAVHNGTYIPGRGREVRIPKDSGYRVLTVQDSEDKVVGRGIVNIIQPLLDPMFDDRSNGYRPGRGRQHALAQAMVVSRQENRPIWVTADLKDAFDRVPLQRLADVLRRYLSDDLVQLMLQVVGKRKKRGLRQGQPLSALLLNVYLDYFLDRVWRKRYPDIPLFRTADDILVACLTMEEALQVRASLEQILTPAGMLPSRDAGKDGIATLSHGQTAQWLGAAVSLGKHGHEVRLAEKSWRKLAVNLERAHQEPAPSLLAMTIMEDWAKQIGFCYSWSDSRQVYVRVVTIARELAFEEVPDYQSFRDGWQGAHKRWQSLYAAIERSGGVIGGSACHCSFSAFSRRSDGAPHGAPSLSFSPHERTTLYADGCCLPRSRAGGWAYLIEAPSPRNAIRRAGGLHRTTNNRAELLAVIRGLESISPPASICIVTDSEYVAHGINEHLPGWKLRGWRAGFGRRKRPLQNADLWQRLDGLLEPHDVTCEWTKGHADCCQNRDCDQRARQAAEIQQERT